jgi:hypothetical protein
VSESGPQIVVEFLHHVGPWVLHECKIAKSLIEDRNWSS